MPKRISDEKSISNRNQLLYNKYHFNMIKYVAIFISSILISVIVEVYTKYGSLSTNIDGAETVHDRDFVLQALSEIEHISTIRPHDEYAADVLHSYLKLAVPRSIQYSRIAAESSGNDELAWGLGYHLQAAVAAYSTTNDTIFLEYFEQGFEAALLLRDDVMGRRDSIRGEILPAWGSYAYSTEKNQWITWDALTGMVTYPAVKYAALVISNPKLDDRHSRAKRYLLKAREAVHAFAPWWRDMPNGSGFYFDPLYGDIAPLNHMNLLGLAHLALCTGFQDERSCHIARGLGSFFKQSMRDNHDRCIWAYWEGAAEQDTIGEDISHAFINVEFADELHRAGMVFTDSDMECIANTFAKLVVRRGQDWAARVDGSGNMIRQSVHYGLPTFVRLGRFRPELAYQINAFILSNPSAFPLGLLSYATGPKAFAEQLSR